MAKRIKSAIKRSEVAERNRLRNTAVKSEVKTRFKHVREADPADAGVVAELLKKAISTIDRAAQKGVIHRNAANRRKSRLVKALAAKGMALQA